MAYAILRVEKTKNTSIAGKNSHNMRLRKTHNADPNLKSQNRILIGSGDLRTDINARFQATNVKARNSTSVICNELVLTASPEFFANTPFELLPNPLIFCYFQKIQVKQLKLIHYKQQK